MPKYTVRKRKKRTNSKIHKSNIQKYIILVLVFSGASLLLLSLFAFNKLNQEFASAESSSSFDIKNESFYSVAYMVADDFNTDPITLSSLKLLIIDKESLRLVVYDIPISAQIDVPGKYGVEPFSNILALGSLNGSDKYLSGVNLVDETILKLFGFPVERYILVNTQYAPHINSLIKGETPFSLFDIDVDDLQKSVKTNFTLNEFVDLYKFANSLPSDRIVNKAITETYMNNFSLLDDELLDITFSGNISKENLSIAVLNSTKESGAANFGARVVRNLGGRVVAVGNAYEPREKSLIIANDINSNTVRVLSNALDIPDVMSMTDASNFSEGEIFRSDVTIIIGLDLANSL